MRVLLFSCPDATHPLFPRFSRSPQLGLCMLAAMVKDFAEVKVADLVIRNRDVPQAVREALEKVRPDLVGISSMTFQYYTARRLAAMVRKLAPGVRIVLGGYHASLNYRAIAEDPAADFDFIVRGEGEVTFQQLVRTLTDGKDLSSVNGLSYRKAGAFVHNPPREVEPLANLPLPYRDARLWRGYQVLGTPFDHIESSRGCTMPCTFCSITRHYGRNYRTYEISRVIEDIRLARARGAREMFFVDDNITLDPERFEVLCKAIKAAGLDDVNYSAQASVAGLHGRESLVRAMAEANFDLVFLGIENMSPRNLSYYKKGDIAKKTEWVLRRMREHDMLVMGGFILGSPQDTVEDILAQFDFMRRWSIDCFLIQILTPYPGTPLSEELERQGYIVNRDYRRYSGYFANVRTDTLSSRQLDFLKWKHQPYYRDPKWFRDSTAARRDPLRMFSREGIYRIADYLREKTRILLHGEEYAFLKHCEEHLRSNCFFGEKVEPVWPDEEPAPAGAAASR